ncbi:MAG: YebC/PmpR family DNA-binding transcriptional regulator [Oscillospiraceae bacterium]|jgi:YebC/PmpR family DNA-binding regulatory protein|nr:YebC/PmpR family DNA-binding transcriptional regulator [Oscillospiraceae bacterium]
MSGHSKWNNIREKKGKTDAQKAKVVTKISREILVAAKEGGGANPDTNGKLRDVIAKARANNVPNDNIKRLLDKAAGANNAENYEANIYEGYGPAGVAVMVETMTDNRNRTASEMRHLFDKYGSGMGAQNSVSWGFERKGFLAVTAEGTSEDALMEHALDAGADDIGVSDGYGEDGDETAFEILTSVENFSAVRDELSSKGYSFLRAELVYLPGTTVEITDDADAERFRKLIDALEDNDDVQNVWANDR